ncbi:hypothetical protein GGF46_000119 [Coemansia sp. RSA 552]|nr:hypothetical protein GGF46_000119 [Coemansia sp. RSA 552]
MASPDVELRVQDEAEHSASETSVDVAKQQVPLLRYILALFTAALLIFLAGYDFFASASALPVIGARLRKLSTVNWVVVAYMLPLAVLMPSVTKLAAVCGRRPVLLVFGLFHLAGSAMSGAADSMPLLLAGRAIAGIGAAGTAIIPIMAVAETGTVAQQTLGLRILLAVWLVGSVVGLAAGGHLATVKHWRWVFYFDLPFLGLALPLSAMAIRLPAQDRPGLVQGLKRVDGLGMLFATGAMLTLVLGLNYGGNLFKWSSGVVITLLILALVLCVVFVFVEAKIAKEPMVPPSMFGSRASAALTAMQPLIGVATYAPIVYLILWYSTVKGQSVANTSEHMLAVAIAMLVAAAVAEADLALVGRCRPLIRLVPLFLALGAGLLIILKQDTGAGIPAIFMALVGIGAGLSLQPQFITLHKASRQPMASIVASVMFLRLTGAVVAIALCNAVLQTNLSTKLAETILRHPLFAKYILDSVDNTDVIRLSSVPQSVRDDVLSVNVDAFRNAFIACFVLAAVAIPLLALVRRASAAA